MTDKSVFNFGPGPAMLPREVMLQVQNELLDWNGTGISVIEMSHRSKGFLSIVEQAEIDLREILAIPDNYKILYVPGGATAMMSMVPLNLLANGETGDYLVTGSWSKKAYKEAKRLANINLAADSEEANYFTIPDPKSWKISNNSAYLYYTDNETITGVEFDNIPQAGDVPLVCDMTSNFLSRPFDVSLYGIAFASAQKNFGPAGIACVVIREDLIGKSGPKTPFLCDFKIYSDNDSMFNTPPTFSWYMAGLIYKWIKQQGGLDTMDQLAKAKSEKLYNAIDGSDMYSNPIKVNFRSRMNVPFILSDSELDKIFLSEAKEHGLIELKGHRSVGGMRASIYNGMPMEGVNALVDFMQDFEKRHG
ncbi:MAG: 3-phosphoserine/phosphohydroxythreonine transaminase [Gammaproteobacteria bacterium]|jgi:phosphoserine aminotransferase